jgi:hypothetical protein
MEIDSGFFFFLERHLPMLHIARAASRRCSNENIIFRNRDRVTVSVLLHVKGGERKP